MEFEARQARAPGGHRHPSQEESVGGSHKADAGYMPRTEDSARRVSSEQFF